MILLRHDRLTPSRNFFNLRFLIGICLFNCRAAESRMIFCVPFLPQRASRNGLYSRLLLVPKTFMILISWCAWLTPSRQRTFATPEKIRGHFLRRSVSISCGMHDVAHAKRSDAHDLGTMRANGVRTLAVWCAGSLSTSIIFAPGKLLKRELAPCSRSECGPDFPAFPNPLGARGQFLLALCRARAGSSVVGLIVAARGTSGPNESPARRCAQ